MRKNKNRNNIVAVFSELSSKDVEIAGGKGASLGEMIRVGISVPPGFVILSMAFEKFLDETGLNVEIEAILDSVNHKEIHTVEGASEKIKAFILQAEMPKNIAEEIQKFFKKLNSKYVAVRSSATAEDSANAAWAGQLESYLNTTEETLLGNVKKCWASLFTPRAIFYRFERDLHKQKISVAVVVQKMVESEKSGIAFSVHPVTQDRNQLIIEAGFGLGEAIVSGQVTPNSYVIEKQPRRIIDKNVQMQSRGLYRAEDGGSEWRHISKKWGAKQVLSDKDILVLSEIIINIEKHYGFPCDIEWAYAKKKFYIVQSRPITTLKRKMTTSRINSLLALIKEKEFIVQKTGTTVSTAYPLVEAATIELAKRLPKSYDPLVCLVIDNTIFYSPEKTSAFNVGRHLLLIEKNQKGAVEHLYNIWRKDFEIFIRYCNKLFETDLSTFTDKNLLRKYKKFCRYYINEYSLALTTDGFGFWMDEYFPSILSKKIKNGKSLSKLIIKLTQPTKISFLEQEKRDLEFIIQKYALSRKMFYTHGAYEEYYRRYYWIRSNYLRRDPVTTNYFKKKIAESLASTSRLEDYTDIKRSKNEIIKKLKLGKEISTITVLIDLTTYWQDQRKMANMRANYWLHAMNSEIAKRRKVRLKEVERLTPYEIMNFFVSQKRKFVAESKKRKKRFGVIGTSKEILIIPSQEIDKVKDVITGVAKTNTGIINGVAASPGIVRGQTRIIHTVKEINKIKDGEILVCSMTRPELMSAVKKARAIITDEGGITCHAAIISRELNIPCVIGTKIATQILKNGDTVEVDADNGIVRIIKSS